MARLSAEDRFRSDPLFAAIVNHIYYFAVQAHTDGNTFTPTELREAAMLAAMKFEQTHARPFLVFPDQP